MGNGLGKVILVVLAVGVLLLFGVVDTRVPLSQAR